MRLIHAVASTANVMLVTTSAIDSHSVNIPCQAINRAGMLWPVLPAYKAAVFILAILTSDGRHNRCITARSLVTDHINDVARALII